MLWLSAGFAVIYGAWFCNRAPSLLRSVIKTIPLSALAVFAAANGAPWLLVAALGLSALGDLALSRNGDRAFLTGLISFAAAHLCYVALLVPWAQWPALLPALVIVALACSTLVWLLPYTGKLRLPVAIYVALIGAMGLSATAQTDAIIWIGAALFLASDTVLAVQLFRLPEGSKWHAAASVSLWAFYVLGQYLLMRGLG